MILGLTPVSDANIARLFEDPPLVWRLLMPDNPEMYDIAKHGARGCLVVWLTASPADEPAADFDLVTGEGEEMDLDKAWHGLHFLYTGTAWEGAPPLNFLAVGGREVGKVDVGYGPARVFSAAETRAIHHALAAQHIEELRERFEPGKMSALQIYPDIWARDDVEEEDPLSELLAYHAVLVEFLGRIVERELGLIVAIQ